MGQLQNVFQNISTEFFKEVDVQKFVDDGVACQTLVLDSIQGLLGDSDDKARSCQSTLIPPPTSIDALASTNCFSDVVNNIKAKLSTLVNPTIECLKTANITVHNEFIQHIFKLTEEGIVQSVKSIIIIPGQADKGKADKSKTDNNMEVTTQVEAICDAVTPAFAEKVDMHKFYLNDCQLIVANHLQYIVGASDEAIRKCQSDTVPAPTSIQALTSTKCFDDVVTNITTKLPKMVSPTEDCMKKANITVDNNFMQDMLQLTEKNVILSVLSIIKIPGQVDSNTIANESEVEDQFEYVLQIVLPVLASKIDMAKLFNGGAECRELMANSIRALLGASDISVRKCQSDIVPAPTTVEAVTSAKCYGDVVTNVKTKLDDLVKPTVDCLKKADITVDNSIIQDILQLAEKSVIESVQSVIKIAAQTDNNKYDDDNVLEEQLSYVSQIVVPALAGKVDMLKLMDKGSKCQSLLASSIRNLLGVSDNAARKCQRDMVPKPKTIEAVTSTKCFENVATNVKTTLADLVKPTVDCLKNVDIAVENAVIQDILQLAEKSIVASVRTIIKIDGQTVKVTNENEDEVEDQLEFVSQIMMSALAGKIDMLKLMNVDPDCQSLLANNLRALLGASDKAARICQSNITPTPTTVEAVTSTKCFEDVATNVKTKLTDLVKPTVECLKKADITFADSVTQDLLQLAEKNVIVAVQGILKIAGQVDTSVIDNDVEDQLDYVSQIVVPALAAKIDMLKLLNSGTDCQSLVANSIRDLLGASDKAVRKCQGDMVPKPTTVEAVTSSKCFEDVSTNIKAKLNELVKPTGDCLKKADIIVANSVILDILQLAEKSVIDSVRNIIKISGSFDNNINSMNINPYEVDSIDQVEDVFDSLMPALTERVDMQKLLMNGGAECQSNLANNIQALLKESDTACRKCQSDIVPVPTSVEAVASTKCFADIVTNIKTKLIGIVNSAADCWRKATINVKDSFVQEFLQLAQNAVVHSVQNTIRAAGKFDNKKNINLNVIPNPSFNLNPNPKPNANPTLSASDSEALEQVDAVFEALVPVLIEKIDLQKLMNSGADCQTVLANNMQALFVESNTACRKCQSDINPAPTSIEAVTSTKCFSDVVTNINTKLINMMYPTIDCWNKANFPIDNSFAQKVLQLAQNNVILTVQNNIKITNQPDLSKSFNTIVNMGLDQNEVAEQIKYVFQIVAPVFAEKIGMQKFMEKVVGSDCQTLVLNTLESLLGASDDAARKCQSNISPAPTSVESVTSTKCFAEVIVNIKTNMSSLVKPAAECLKKADIVIEDGVVQQVLALTEDSVIKAVQNIIKIHG